MTFTRTIAIVVIPLIILGLGTISTMRPVRAYGMSLYTSFDHWNVCVPSSTSSSLTLYNNIGPYGMNWVVWVGIGLSGGDNLQYVAWSFYISEPSQGNVQKGFVGASTYQWVAQGITQYGSMSGAFVQGLGLTLNIDNTDSVAQCFSVTATTWNY